MVLNGSHRTTRGVLTLATLALFTVMPQQASGQPDGCLECISIRVGPATVVRGPYRDELDGPFTALRLPDGRFRGFTANGSTYAVDGRDAWDMRGDRREVLPGGPPGSQSDCGRWITTALRDGGIVVGFVHQERICDYNAGNTDKSMAIAVSSDDGLNWTDLGTVMTGTDSPTPGQTTGEGDCTLVDGHDGFLYAYCLRASDWQTIVARTPLRDLTGWRKYHEGDWRQPGLGGEATAIGFLGPTAGYLEDFGVVAAVTSDKWFEGIRLSVSTDKVTFTDLREPLLPIDPSSWERPDHTALVAYTTIVDPDTGSNSVSGPFLLSYLHVPAGKGFESRYLVHHEVTVARTEEPNAIQTGVALSRWVDPERGIHVSSTGPLTGDRQAYRHDALVAYMLTRAPDDLPSVKLAECASTWPGHLDQVLARDGECDGYTWERTAGWLLSEPQPGTVPVYRCTAKAALTHLVSNRADCEGLGETEFLLGYGLAP